jgi:hypothetical protein
MAKPTNKSPEIEKFIQDVFGTDRKKCIAEGKCAFCGKDATSFKDTLSEKEFTISGLCQKCQDKVWKP